MLRFSWSIWPWINFFPIAWTSQSSTASSSSSLTRSCNILRGSTYFSLKLCFVVLAEEAYPTETSESHIWWHVQTVYNRPHHGSRERISAAVLHGLHVISQIIDLHGKLKARHQRLCNSQEFSIRRVLSEDLPWCCRKRVRWIVPPDPWQPEAEPWRSEFLCWDCIHFAVMNALARSFPPPSKKRQRLLSLLLFWTASNNCSVCVHLFWSSWSFHEFYTHLTCNSTNCRSGFPILCGDQAKRQQNASHDSTQCNGLQELDGLSALIWAHNLHIVCFGHTINAR